jgi:HEAT repeat protein
VPALLEALRQDRDRVNRGSAATALGRIGSAEGVPALIEALSDEASEVRGSAAAALGRIGTEQAISAVLDSVPDLLEALGRGGHEQLSVAANVILRPAFRSGNLQLVTELIQRVELHLAESRDMVLPHRVAADYLLSNRDQTILRRQHPEVREAVELLVAAFDEGEGP